METHLQFLIVLIGVRPCAGVQHPTLPEGIDPGCLQRAPRLARGGAGPVATTGIQMGRLELGISCHFDRCSLRGIP